MSPVSASSVTREVPSVLPAREVGPVVWVSVAGVACVAAAAVLLWALIAGVFS